MPHQDETNVPGHISALELDFKRKQKTYFEDNYGSKNISNWLRYERREILQSFLDEITEVSQIVDVGCGPAILYPEVLARCDTYWAVDVVETNLEEASYNQEKVKTIKANMDDFDWHFETLPNVIIASGSLEYTKQPLDNVEKILGALADGGSFVASFPNKASPYRLWTEYVHIPLKNLLSSSAQKKSIYKRKLFRYKDLVARVEKNNSVVLRTEWLGFCFIPYPLNRALPKATFFIDKWFEKRMPFLKVFATEFIVHVEKK